MHHLDEDEDQVTRSPQGPHVVAQQSYYEARQRADVAKRVYSEAYRAQKEAESKLIEACMDLGITRLDYMSDGTKLHLRGQVSISVTQANEWQAREWLRETYGDDSEFSIEKLNKPAITEKIREDIQSGQLSETAVPDFFKLNQYPTVSVSGWTERKET